ncbi:MAG TPA: hypothetical protein VNO55_03410 [Polyangia bacterium]|nr:hypothetical protein [Polyangia bacterium]
MKTFILIGALLAGLVGMPAGASAQGWRGGGGHVGGGGAHFGGGGARFGGGGGHAGGWFSGHGYRGGFYGGGPAVHLGVHAGVPVRSHVWVPGYWGWRGGARIWIGGGWYAPPYDGWVWVAPGWVWNGYQWVWQEGRWAAPGY